MMIISAMRRGSEAIILVTSHRAPSISRPCVGAAMPMVVRMQVARATVTRSVGEKRSPFPWLSTGASVSIVLPERVWVALVRSPPV